MSRSTRRLLITAGPTHEPLDAVRYIANRSSGKLGVALAQAGRDAGWSVTLLLGPTPTAPPEGVTTHRFASSGDLAALLDERFPACDALIMAAAVADYRPARPRPGKLPRQPSLTLELESTPDLVARCAQIKRPDQTIIGFALEALADLDRRAAEKLHRKGLDAIVANPLSTLASDEIDAALLTPERGTQRPGPMDKPAFARWLVAQIDALAPRDG